jgi:predicted transcriptional regulator
MNKDPMSAPKSKAWLDSLNAETAAIDEPEAPAQTGEIKDEASEPVVVAERRAPVRLGKGVDLQAIRAALPKKETPVQQPVRIPPALKEDLNLLCFALGKTKNDFIAEAVAKEVAREKKRLGMD